MIKSVPTPGNPRMPNLRTSNSGVVNSGMALELAARGYHAVYREQQVNHCPGCGRTHWIIGRVSAECAFCATALPLAEASMRSNNATAVIVHRNRASSPAWAA